MKDAIILGKGTLAIRVSESLLATDNHELAAVVPVLPEPEWTESFASWARDRGIPVIQSGAYTDIPQVQDSSRNLDLVISVFYDKIIERWLIDKCNQIINIHNSPLPKYRGVAPINWALKNQEEMHGVTIHEITEGIDDGPIIAQVKYSIYPEFDEVADVYQRSLTYALSLFEQTLPLLDKITPRPQNENEATYYSKEDTKSLGDRMSWTKEQSRNS